MFARMKLGTKLLIGFLVVGVIPFATVGAITLYKSSQTLSQSAFNQLEAMRGVKKAQLERFFAEREGDLGVLLETVAALQQEAFHKLETVQENKRAEIEAYFAAMRSNLHVVKDNPWTAAALTALDRAFTANGDSADGPRWRELARGYDPVFEDLCADFGWYDVFLINPEGRIVYTMAKEADLGQSISREPLRGSSLGNAFARLQADPELEIAVGDFAPYAPSDGRPAAFMMARLKDTDGQLVGHVAFQIGTDHINAVMQRRHGMGRTGESYLVGDNGETTAFRSAMLTMGDGAYVVGHEIHTPYIDEILETRTSFEHVYTDSQGDLVMVTADPVALEGLNWAIVSKIDLEEAIAPHVEGRQSDYFSDYIARYGYYDLFLVHPEGKVFYTVTREADYGTNLVDGEYADSNLGRLVRTVLSTGRYGFADFAPYAPSDDAPCAFIAQPVMHEGEVELVVALQLSLEAINGVMQQRDGMGATGETYLVGPDLLMRSDSFLDPTHHSVAASFADPAAGKVDTAAVHAALAGKTGARRITDYNGNPVLSAFTPLTVGGTTWAMIAEIDAAEAFAAVHMMEWLIGIIAVVGIAAILLVAWLITRSITRPINRVITGLNDGADQVASASGQVSAASQQLAEGSSEQAASLEETSASLEEMSSMTNRNADSAGQADSLMQEANQVVDQANGAMGQLTESMTDISKASEETSKIIKTIDEIAFQTNLLALNAAVEAARAGEAGAGFAVVADEVRNLAMRAAEAAKETAQLIEGTVKRVNEGTGIVTKTNESFSRVADSAGKVGELVAEIAAASKEQAQGIGQVNTAVTEMDKVTQQNAANAEESASASEELSAQAAQMKGMVDELVALVGGTAVKKGGNAQGTATNRAVFHHKHPAPSGKPTTTSAAEERIAPQPKPAGPSTSNELKPLEEGELQDF